MPFRSESQRRFMWAKHPKIARRWAKKYGSKIHPTLKSAIQLFSNSAKYPITVKALTQARWPKGSPKGGQWKDQSPSNVSIDKIFSGSGKISNDVIKTISRIHMDGSIPNTKIIETSGLTRITGAQAMYSPRNNRIFIESQGPWPRVSASHEMGHAIDLHGFGKGRNYGSANSPKFKEFHKAVEQSRTIKKWRAWEKQGAVEVNGVKYILPKSSYKYTLNKPEIWARAYAQYIALKSRNPQFRADLFRRQNNPLAGQWDDDEFRPIYNSIEKLLKSEGWM